MSDTGGTVQEYAEPNRERQGVNRIFLRLAIRTFLHSEELRRVEQFPILMVYKCYSKSVTVPAQFRASTRSDRLNGYRRVR